MPVFEFLQAGENSSVTLSRIRWLRAETGRAGDFVEVREGGFVKYHVLIIYRAFRAQFTK